MTVTVGERDLTLATAVPDPPTTIRLRRRALSFRWALTTLVSKKRSRSARASAARWCSKNRRNVRACAACRTAPKVRGKRKDPPKRVLFVLILDCAWPALLLALFSRHRVFKEILVLRCEAFRELKNLKAVPIADGPELDVG